MAVQKKPKVEKKVEKVNSDAKNKVKAEPEIKYDRLQHLEEENKVLKEALFQFKQELGKYRTPPLMIADFVEWSNEPNKGIIQIANGNRFLVNISAEVEDLKADDTILVEQKNLTVLDKVNKKKKFNVEQFVIVDKPNIKWDEIGGLTKQIEEIKEVIELPILKPDLFKKMGINPPKGILLHGPPGTGKTILAKAVASSTKSTFIELVGSELVQKFIGEGAKLVKEVFQLAREKAPTIVFIDEIDSIASARIEVGTSGEREVQRTFMQLLAELDGFKNLDNVKIIGCTNRKDILDAAVTRPGRLDRMIEVPNPDPEGIKQIFKIHSKNMNKKDLNEKILVEKMEGLSGAEIKSVCTETGYFAIRNNRFEVIQSDFEKAIDKVKDEDSAAKNEFKHMFG